MSRSVAELVRIVEAFTEDELAVVIQVAQGLAAGRHVYGPLEIADDGRDWIDELKQEDRDALVYLSAELIRRTRASVDLLRFTPSRKTPCASHPDAGRGETALDYQVRRRPL